MSGEVALGAACSAGAGRGKHGQGMRPEHAGSGCFKPQHMDAAQLKTATAPVTLHLACTERT